MEKLFFCITLLDRTIVSIWVLLDKETLIHQHGIQYVYKQEAFAAIVSGHKLYSTEGKLLVNALLRVT